MQQFARHDIYSMVCICPEWARFLSAFVSAYLSAVGKGWPEPLLWVIFACVFLWLGLSRVQCDLPTRKPEFFHQWSEIKAEFSVPALLLCPVLVLLVSALPHSFAGIILQFSTQLPHVDLFARKKLDWSLFHCSLNNLFRTSVFCSFSPSSCQCNQEETC